MTSLQFYVGVAALYCSLLGSCVGSAWYFRNSAEKARVEWQCEQLTARNMREGIIQEDVLCGRVIREDLIREKSSK